jgi:hypothetical protein
MVAWKNRVKAEAKRSAMLVRRPPCKGCGGKIPDDRWASALFCTPACKKKFHDALWRERSPHYNRQYLYGVTPEEYEAKLAALGGQCAICGSGEWPGKGNRPHTDHDHETGRFRGILCGNCNNALGMFGEDPARLRAAAAYLEAAAS